MIKIFCDFDGTVSLGDVGDQFFTIFTDGKCMEPVRLWEEGKIDSREMYLRGIRDLHVTPEEFEKFIREQRLDPYFPEFAKFCEQRGIPVAILSDGMDLYIRPLLERNGLGHLTVYSNVMRWNSDGTLTVEFPYYAHSCGRCANCKGYHLRRLREKGDRMVFIGDGLSDLCAVKEADVVLAKDELETYCRNHRIPFIPYQDFSDVLSWLQSELQKYPKEINPEINVGKK